MIAQENKLKKYCEALNNKGYNASLCTMCGGSTAIKVVHDYEGLYPPKEVYNVVGELRKFAKRRNLQCDTHTSYVGTFLRYA